MQQVPQTYLSHSCAAGNAWHERPLISVAEVQVHNLMGESGELIAEADFVDALHSRGVREAVILLLPLVIQDVVLRIGDETVHIVVAS